ncbi:MAG: hypothetical protein ACTSQY_03215 [Candidatus Odinarchaeia archaeon]
MANELTAKQIIRKLIEYRDSYIESGIHWSNDYHRGRFNLITTLLNLYEGKYPDEGTI